MWNRLYGWATNRNIADFTNHYLNVVVCVQLIQNINDFYLINKIFAIYLLTDPCFIWCFIIWNYPCLWFQLLLVQLLYIMHFLWFQLLLVQLLYIMHFRSLCWNYKLYNLYTLHNKYKYLYNTWIFLMES